MKANELRIGNWVNTPNQNQNPFRVDYFDELKVYMKTGTYNAGAFGDIPFHPLTWDISQLSPIPLTPEVLEKCGLSRDSEGWFLSFDLKIYDPLVRNGVGGLSQNDFKIVSILYGTKLFPIGIKYLHQLQNLYFAITGKELTYTP